MIKYISIMCVMLLLLSSCDHKDEIIEVDNNTMTWEIDYTNINTNKIEDIENTLWNWIEGIDKDFDKNISNADYQLDIDLKKLYVTYEQDKILIESSQEWDMITKLKNLENNLSQQENVLFTKNEILRKKIESETVKQKEQLSDDIVKQSNRLYKEEEKRNFVPYIIDEVKK